MMVEKHEYSLENVIYLALIRHRGGQRGGLAYGKLTL